MANPFEVRAQELSQVGTVAPEQSASPFEVRANELDSSGMVGAFGRGWKSGVSGLMTGQGEQVSREEQPWYERAAELTGELVSDLPAMSIGGETGGLIGSVIPGGGTVVGATAGAFALPAMIKNSFAEYRDFASKGGDASFGDFIERTGRVAKETGKSAIIGGVTGKMSKFLPYLKEVPGMSKILETRLGKALGTGALELAGMTGAETAIEGRLPTTQQFVERAATLAGTHVAGAVSKKLGVSKLIEPITRPLVDKSSEIANKLGSILPEPVKDVYNLAKKGISKVRRNAAQKQFFEMLEDTIGERDAKIVESQFNWRDKLETAEKSGEFTEKVLEEMMYYRQKTGNPFVEGDTFEALAKRMPNNARKLVNETINDHLEKTFNAHNANPATRNINPREALEGIYLTGLYEGTPEQIRSATEKVQSKYGKDNPLANQKTFLTMLDAYKQAGLKPRYKNIIELMGAYDKIMIKSMATSNLIGKMKAFEKENNTRLVVNASDKEAYAKAKADGYVPFDSPFLKGYTTGDKGAEYGAPALVSPDAAQAFQGIFNKNAFKPEYELTKYVDALSNYIKFKRIAVSTFHYGALMESALGGKGLKALSVNTWLKEAYEQRNNKEFMMDAARAGLKVEPFEREVYKQGQRLFDKVEALTGAKTPEAIKKLEVATKKKLNFLFDEFHPALKLTTWNDYVTRNLGEAAKDGKILSEKEIRTVKKQCAELVNNMYGGQRWETMKYFNNPEAMKWLRRAIGYPDWSVSAARQFSDMFASGLKGKMGRKYWAKYGMFATLATGALKFLNAGWTQTDPDETLRGIRWDRKKAWDGLVNDDPEKWYQFGLPDFNVKIGGETFNPGRDENGKKLYSHVGKQYFEVPRYFTNTIPALFSKSNPLIQIIGKQMFDGTPSEDGMYPARAKFKHGKSMPWEGTEKGTLGRFVSRAKEVVSDIVPFSIKGVAEKGIAPTIASGLGMFPISQGTSITKAESLVRKALKRKDYSYVNKMRNALGRNGYNFKQIKAMMSRARKD